MTAHHCDLHLHSALSPCADDDNTPNNLVGMASLNGLDVIALTDHNSCRNCRAAMRAGERMGVIVVPGMELTTAEEIHVVCLFPTADAAEAFGLFVEERMMKIPNRPEIFGRQRLMDEDDRETGELPWLLSAASEIGFEEVPAAVRTYGGVCMPAHVDRHANGVLAILGDLRADMGYVLGEVSRNAAKADYAARFPFLKFFQDSDAHFLWDVAEAGPDNLLTGEIASAAEAVALIGQK